MAEIILKGRRIPLSYTVYEMKQIQEEICPLGDFQYVVFGRNKEDEKDTSGYASPKHLEAIAKLVRILGNAGLEEAGEAPDLTDKYVLRSMRPKDINEAVSACMKAMSEGMASEIPEKTEDGPVDVTLEEMKKKEQKEG